MERSQLFWQTYLNLEKEFLEIAKYIYITDEKTIYSNKKYITEPCTTQLETFSPHIADLLIRTCIEIEAISKELYFNYGGEKNRGDRNLLFDIDCLKLVDIKCKTHLKEVMVACPSINLTKEENICFKPLKDAHRGQGNDWERAYQALKHDRYSSISKGTIKNLLHALGALYLLNIYYKNNKLTVKYYEVYNMDLSLGSSIFSVKQPSQKYLLNVVNNQDVTGILTADESPFILKYTDTCYKQILDANKKIGEEIMSYVLAQPEFKEPEFVQQVLKANQEGKDTTLLSELSKYRLQKKIPTDLTFEERKRLLVASSEWKSLPNSDRQILREENITENNIQEEIENLGIISAALIQQRFDNTKWQKAFGNGECELILDTGDIEYKL